MDCLDRRCDSVDNSMCEVSLKWNDVIIVTCTGRDPMDLQSRVILTTKAHKAKLIYFRPDDPPNGDMRAVLVQCGAPTTHHGEVNLQL